MTYNPNQRRTFGQIMFFMAAAFCVIFGGLVIGSVFVDTKTEPLMKCDPAKLIRGMSKDYVVGYCGEPDRRAGDVNPEAWYPLDQGPRENKDMWVYGNISDKTRNVNLYFTDDKLRSVQIYGSGR